MVFTVPSSKTVPALYPEAPEFQAIPEVFATGFLIGLLEWACIPLVNPHLDWPTRADPRHPHRRQPPGRDPARPTSHRHHPAPSC